MGGGRIKINRLDEANVLTVQNFDDDSRLLRIGIELGC
jgi:hypothetical protein